MQQPLAVHHEPPADRPTPSPAAGARNLVGRPVRRGARQSLAHNARIKRLYRIDPQSVSFVRYGESRPVLQKDLLRDVLADLDAHSVSVPDKLEGTAVGADGKFWLVTDNDGVDENDGETLFFSIGNVRRF